MTDKQIIIDGVDVSGCIVFDNKWGTPLCNPTEDIREAVHCSDNPNCLYKKYKRKEQECEELKEINSTLLEYRRHAVTCQDCYEDGLEDGKTSNKELRKLKQTLAEIKEIAYDGYNNGQTSYATFQCEKIINKINEVEDEIKN